MEIEKKLCQRIALLKRVPFVEWKSALKKEGKKKLRKQISLCESKKFKVTINFNVYIFLH